MFWLFCVFFSIAFLFCLHRLWVLIVERKVINLMCFSAKVRSVKNTRQLERTRERERNLTTSWESGEPELFANNIYPKMKWMVLPFAADRRTQHHMISVSLCCTGIKPIFTTSFSVQSTKCKSVFLYEQDRLCVFFAHTHARITHYYWLNANDLFVYFEISLRSQCAIQ